MPNVELIYFDGCPNAGAARSNLQQALAEIGASVPVTEWNQLDAAAPDRVKRFGSPTVLVNGRDITGVGEGAGMTCCSGGAPSVVVIRNALAAAE